MTDDPVEAMLFASFYLFGPQNGYLTQQQKEAVKQLLVEQRNWVEVYSNFIGSYFLVNESCKVAASSGSCIWSAMARFPSLGFVIPEEGTFISIENLVIPKSSQKEDLIYQFICYLFQEKSIRTHFETYGYFPSTLHSFPNLSLPKGIQDLVFISEENFNKFRFVQKVMPKPDIDQAWIELKSGKY